MSLGSRQERIKYFTFPRKFSFSILQELFQYHRHTSDANELKVVTILTYLKDIGCPEMGLAWLGVNIFTKVLQMSKCLPTFLLGITTDVLLRYVTYRTYCRWKVELLDPDLRCHLLLVGARDKNLHPRLNIAKLTSVFLKAIIHILLVWGRWKFLNLIKLSTWCYVDTRWG